MNQKSNRRFLTVLVAMAFTAAALILSVPPLFEAHEPYQLGLTLTLAALASALGAAVLVMRARNRA
ncbi:hypothetical protein BJ994_002477 [Arthrobacter pigmenti]|uniref:Uncharacterized protein n=1 Tax=Arthrobacter pigmenti TaxID=271432 RepID=A0A846RYX4_9MICC|nr:hypothetical protein [Arthrobacter pigmenti]